MTATNAKFVDDVKKFIANTKRREEQVVREVALALLRAVIVRSPVGNPDLWKNPPPAGYVGGHFRGNWFVQEDTAPQERGGTDASGEATISDGMVRIGQFKLGGKLYIVNHLPYGPRLEYEGWSSQTPNGMVRITAAEFQQYVAAAVARAKQP
jgi:hypothetical protein